MLARFVDRRTHLCVKLGLVAKKDRQFGAAAPSSVKGISSVRGPFPPFVVTLSSDSQARFNRRIPFYSLYLEPAAPATAGKSENERAAWSAGGVREFTHVLLDHYAHTLVEVAGARSEKYRYFVERPAFRKLKSGSASEYLVVFKVPREPLVFDNWRELPMPQDPNTVFLSGLLLVHRTIYRRIGGDDQRAWLARAPLALDIGGEEFSKHYAFLKNTVFEIGSVFRTR